MVIVSRYGIAVLVGFGFAGGWCSIGLCSWWISLSGFGVLVYS